MAKQMSKPEANAGDSRFAAPDRRVRRAFVAKKKEFAVEAVGLLRDLRSTLALDGLKDIRIFNRYDLSGLSDDAFSQACIQVLAEPPVDDLYGADCDFGRPDWTLAVEALPGQYDQRADSAAQCVQIITQGERPLCRTARVYAFYGELSEATRDRIRLWLINPVETREASVELPENLLEETSPPPDIALANELSGLDEVGMAAFRSEHGLAMSVNDLRLVRDYFQEQGRSPTWTELRVLDTYWSDHCRHTTFLTELSALEFPDGPFGDQLRAIYQSYLNDRQAIYGWRAAQKPVCLMDLATLAARVLSGRGKLDDLDRSEEINACSIRVPVEKDGQREDVLLMFKNETHNHPTEIEPFGGAATCLGGAIRDPLAGRAYVYQAMRVTGSGDPTVPISETLPGKLPQRRITTTAAAGYSSYGNQIGLATGLVDEIYHPGYIAKRMEVGAVVGSVPVSRVRRQTPIPGDVVLLLGGRTGRDGCGGATGSSKEHNAGSLANCGAEVQKGNPPTERKIQRLFRNPDVSLRIKRCNDFGAGGVSVAVGELAAGVRIDLDRIPRKYEGLDGTELAISESQERMALVVAAEDVGMMIEAAGRENLEATAIAEITAEPSMVMIWRGREIVRLNRDFIDTNGVRQQTRAVITAPDSAASDPISAGYDGVDAILHRSRPADDAGLPFAERLRRRLARLDACSRKGLAERFDASIGAATVLMPYGGSLQLTPEMGMAARIPTDSRQPSDTASLMTYGFDPWLSSHSPFHGAVYAILEALARIAALGGDAASARLSLQEYFERLSDAESWGKPTAALLGAYWTQLACGVAAIGGKDSMSGTFQDIRVPPTLIAFAVATLPARQVLSATLGAGGQSLWLLPVPIGEQGLPDLQTFMRRLADVRSLTGAGKIQAASVVRGDGAAAAVARMCFGNRLGFDFIEDLDDGLAFAAQPAALILAAQEKDLPAHWRSGPNSVRRLGTTTGDLVFRKAGSRLPWQDALRAWEGTLKDVFPTEPATSALNRFDPLAEEAVRFKDSRKRARSAGQAVRVSRPRVLIPVFPGTNCEYDVAAAFERAGGEPDLLVLRNQTAADLRESMQELVRHLDQAQILMLPGGFSSGDEPEGSGKFVAATFRNPAVREATERLLGQRDGLALGICNGFQALIKLGLLPFGRTGDLTPTSATLTFNRIGRHVSSVVRVRVVSNRSPWLYGAEPGAIAHIPVSHGEGRFHASPDVLDRLRVEDLIATCYVDGTGRPAFDSPENPNGSAGAIEGLVSPDGRVFGKMAHDERTGSGLLRNVPSGDDLTLFASGVRYFS